MSVTNVKRGDTEVSWSANMDLTGATVKLFARASDSATVEQLDATVTDAATGTVTVDVAELLVGRYYIELEVTAVGKTITFPDDGYETLNVVQDLG